MYKQKGTGSNAADSIDSIRGCGRIAFRRYLGRFLGLKYEIMREFNGCDC